MRAFLVALSIAVVACSTGPSAPDSIEGSWANDSSSLSLTQSGDQVTGTAFLSPNTYAVTGTYDRPNVTLNLFLFVGGNQVADSASLVLTGQAVSANTMTLTLGAGSEASTFHRQ